MLSGAAAARNARQSAFEQIAPVVLAVRMAACLVRAWEGEK